MVKGVAVAAGNQPVYILEVVHTLLLLSYVALLLFALGLIGLHTRLKGHGGKSGWVGGALAWASLALAPVVVGSFVFFFLIVAYKAAYDDSQTLVAQIAKDVADTRQLLKTTIPAVD